MATATEESNRGNVAVILCQTSGKQLGTGGGELHIGPGVMPPQPAQRDRAREGGAELVRRAAFLEEGAVDQLDVNSTVLNRLDRVGNLNQLTVQSR